MSASWERNTSGSVCQFHGSFICEDTTAHGCLSTRTIGMPGKFRVIHPRRRLPRTSLMRRCSAMAPSKICCGVIPRRARVYSFSKTTPIDVTSPLNGMNHHQPPSNMISVKLPSSLPGCRLQFR